MEKTINGNPIKILYADDDVDDREFFQDALREAKSDAELTTVVDGEKLIKMLLLLTVAVPTLFSLT